MQPTGPGAALRSTQWYAGLLTLTLALTAPPAATAQQKNLVYNTVPACTVVDTRVAGGAMAPGSTRTYNVVGSGSFASQGGSSTGCGIPGFSNGVAQVQAVALYVTAVNPSAVGFIDAYAADQPFSNSVLNFQAGWGAIADSAMVAVAQSPGIGDFKVTVCCATTDLVVRVVGYYTKPVQTIVVNAVPGDATASGAVLVNALAAISNASAARPYVVKLGPGIYDVGDTRLQMKPFVDVEGSGQQATIVQGNGNGSDTNNGVVLGASSMELRNLQIKSNGSSSRPFAIAIYNSGTSPRITNVTVVTSGGTSGNWGIRNVAASPTVSDVSITVTATGSAAYGISDNGTANSKILRTEINVTNSASGEAVGIHADCFCSPGEIRQARIDVAGTSIAYGVRQTGLGGSSSVATVIEDSTITARNASTTYGVKTDLVLVSVTQSKIRALGSGGRGVEMSGSVTIDHSEIVGALSTVSVFDARIGATLLAGGPASGTCAGVYDENYTFYASTCP